MTICVAGIVLAGGLSRRMGGGDKSLRHVAGATMLTRVIDRLRPQVETMALNANGDPERFADISFPVIADPVEGFAGPLAGVLAGMNWAAMLEAPASHIVTVASDTPFFPTDLVSRLLETNEESSRRIVLATSGGNRHPVFGLWPVSLREPLDEFLRLSETMKVLAFVDDHDHRFADFPMQTVSGRTFDPFFNANTPDDIDAAEAIALGTPA